MIFDLIRNNQKVLQFLLLLLIFPAFAFFGISGYNTFFVADDAVAKVGELPITRYEFENARQAQIQNMRRVFGDQFDESMFDTPEMRNGLLDNLIDQRLVAHEAQESGIVVPDEAVRNAINENRDFRKDDGSFDPERYQNFLSGIGMTGPQYENRLRSNLAFDAIPSALQQTAFVPRAVSRSLAKLQLQKRTYQSRLFKAEDFIDQVQVDTEKAKTYYEQNQREFERPESLKIEYLVLSADELASDIEIGEDEIKRYFEENKRKYLNPERRKLSHILVNMPSQSTEAQKATARDKAQSLLDRIRAGENFEDVAKAESQDPGSASAGGDLGFLERDTVTQSFGDAAFALALDQVSDVVETEDGLHIIKVSKIEPEAGMTFKQARPQIEPALRTEKGREAFLDKADSFNNTVYEQPDSLAPTAEKLGITVQTIDTFTRAGATDLPPDSPLRHPKVVRDLFGEQSLKLRENIEVVSVSDTTLVSARVLDHRPAAVQAFDEVEAEAIAKVRAQESAQLAVKAGQAALEQLQQGQEPNEFEDEKEVTRATSGLAPQARDVLFAAGSDKLPSFHGVELGTSGYMILQLKAVTPAGDDDVDKALESQALQSSAFHGQQSYQDFVEALKQRVPVERNIQALGRPGES